MSIDPSTFVVLFSNDVTKFVFKEVLKNRSAMFKEIRESLSKKPEFSALDNSTLEETVRKLKDADLIKERTAPIEDFNTYYVTADGLTAERQLRLAEPLTASSSS